jgi:hypothetical protein
MPAVWTPFLLALLLAPSAQSQGLIPRVINGAGSPPYAAASVAIETTGDYCTAGLWKPRILITAAHCVTDAGSPVTVTAPSDFIVFPPGADRKAGPSPITVTEVIVDPRWRKDGDDIAFLVLSAPLAAPIITRMATQDEVIALTKAGATISYVGYGLTGPSGDENSVVSDVPLGVSERLDADGDSGGVESFETVGDGTSGTCQGDSGGPWMIQIGAELLYIGPLSGGAGPPCDDPADFAWEYGAVASRHSALISRALAAAGEPADPASAVIRTCTKVSGWKTAECVSGTSWAYDRCWEAPKASLEKFIDGAWRPVARMTAKRSRDCPRRYPYNVVFRGDEATGTARFRVVLPKQKGLRGGGGEQFTVTHPSPGGG